MKTTITLCFVPLLATVLFAQGPRGGRGFEGPGGFGGRGAGLLGAGPGSRMLVTGAPFSAVETLQTQQTLANGNQISNKDTIQRLPGWPGSHSNGRDENSARVLGQGRIDDRNYLRSRSGLSICARLIDDDRLSVSFAEVERHAAGTTSAARTAE